MHDSWAGRAEAFRPGNRAGDRSAGTCAGIRSPIDDDSEAAIRTSANLSVLRPSRRQAPFPNRSSVAPGQRRRSYCWATAAQASNALSLARCTETEPICERLSETFCVKFAIPAGLAVNDSICVVGVPEAHVVPC